MIDTRASTNDIKSEFEDAKPIYAAMRVEEDEQMDKDEVKEGDIGEHLKKEIRPYFAKLMADHFRDQAQAQQEVIHANIMCDECEMFPLVGIRYKSTTQADYDICDGCQRQGKHGTQVLLKIRRPEQAPHKIICQFGNGKRAPSIFDHMPRHLDVNVDIGKATSMAQQIANIFGSPA